MNMPPPPPIKGPQQLIEDAMQLYLTSVSDALVKAGNPEHKHVWTTRDGLTTFCKYCKQPDTASVCETPCPGAD